LPEYEDDYAEADSGTARLEDDLDDLLEAMPFRLPSEAEWEYAARAGTTTLTFRGDGKTGEDQLLDDFGDEQRTAAAENAFGLAAMGSANEICADVWIPGFVGAPTDARPRRRMPAHAPLTVGGRYVAVPLTSARGRAATNGCCCSPPPGMSTLSSPRSARSHHCHPAVSQSLRTRRIHRDVRSMPPVVRCAASRQADRAVSGGGRELTAGWSRPEIGCRL
jgi:formylglycine-generating enzyme required for sulfatase activity